MRLTPTDRILAAVRGFEGTYLIFGDSQADLEMVYRYITNTPPHDFHFVSRNSQYGSSAIRTLVNSLPCPTGYFQLETNELIMSNYWDMRDAERLVYYPAMLLPVRRMKLELYERNNPEMRNYDCNYDATIC